MDQHNETEARDVALIGLFFLAYAVLLWYVARRKGQGLGTGLSLDHDAIAKRMDFGRFRRADMIAEEMREVIPDGD